MRPNAPFRTAALTWLLLLGAVAAAAACPMCKEAAPKDPAVAGQLTRGWARSIALLMGTPYLLFAGLTFWVVRSARRRRP